VGLPESHHSIGILIRVVIREGFLVKDDGPARPEFLTEFACFAPEEASLASPAFFLDHSAVPCFFPRIVNKIVISMPAKHSIGKPSNRAGPAGQPTLEVLAFNRVKATALELM
jgi:hypothetical protein